VAIVSEVRLLLGEPAGGSAEYTVLAVLPNNERFLLGQLSGPTPERSNSWATFAAVSRSSGSELHNVPLESHQAISLGSFESVRPLIAVIERVTGNGTTAPRH
jgi:hypothetical protein